jgi:hypothetical protein
MIKQMLAVLAVAAGLSLLAPTSAVAGPPGYYGYTPADGWMYWYAVQQPWHGAYYHTKYGKPVSLVVPPIANKQTHYNWGVTGTIVTPIYSQYGRAYPGEIGAGSEFRPQPYWPSSTDQFGVYYVRGPW